MSEANDIDLSVIICTFNRADSLGVTLESLTCADRENLSVEVVVVDNNSHDHTKNTVDSFKNRIPIRYLFEPKQGNGKSDPLNHALEVGGFGKIVAFLDDDMTVETGWFQGVRAICDRYPNHALFSGRSYVIWPNVEIPGWAKDQQVLQWALSVMENIHEDREIRPGFWPSGNHFWVRSTVFKNGRKFNNLWSEAQFTLGILDEGYRGVYGPEAVAGHRIQLPLLDREVMRRRAILCGKSRANSCLPFHRSVRRAKLLKNHPISFRLFVLANGIRWWVKSVIAGLKPFSDKTFVEELTARMEMANNFESLRIARQIEKLWLEEERQLLSHPAPPTDEI